MSTVVNMSTSIPRNFVFRFENFWLKHQDYPNIPGQIWGTQQNTNDSTKLISAKLKGLRKCLREWQASMTNLKTTIANVRLIMHFLEVITEFRDLSLPEWSFHKILETHPLDLLEKQRIYWKQRGNVKWVQLGDAGTHFFHANATLRHRSKLISQLTSRDETIVYEHKEKEELLWQEFKARMRISEFSGFTVNPSDLIHGNSTLQHLEDPFPQDKIDCIIKSLPNNKLPRPDGFNNEFIKASWPVIKHDFYELCRNFYDNNCCLQSINASYITLIPRWTIPSMSMTIGLSHC